MLDIKFIRENPETVNKVLKDKCLEDTVDIGEIVQVDKKRVSLLGNVESHRALKNSLSRSVSKVSGEKKKELIEEAAKVKAELVSFEKELEKLDSSLEKLLKLVPNLISDDTPIGESEDDNKILREWGKLPVFGFTPKTHDEIGKELGVIDIESSSKVSGSRFAYLLGDAVLMQFALVKYVFDVLTDKKIISKLAKKVGSPNNNVFVPVVPPLMIRKKIMEKMDRFEPADDRYLLKDDLVLIGSAEHSLGPMCMDSNFAPDDLPKRYLGYSPAFRKEAGTYGRDTKGILRLHHFDKLEMESFTLAEDGMSEHEFMVAIQEYIIQELKIPYRVVIVNSSDMGKPDFRHVDIECFLPGQNKYRETHTADYMTDYQARRLNIRCKGKGFVHMNDATAAAIGRTLVAIFENYQNDDGSIAVPKVLRKYMGKKIVGKVC